MRRLVDKCRTALSPQLAKRMAVAIPLVVVAGWGLLRVLPESYSGIGWFLAGFGTYSLARWLWSTKSDRQTNVQRLKAHRQHLVEAFHAHRWFAIEAGLYLLMCAYFLITRTVPAELVVRQLIRVVEILGFFVVFYQPLLVIAKFALYGEGSVASAALRVLRLTALCSAALWLIGHTGDDLYRWMRAHQTETATVITAVVIVRLIGWFSGVAPFGERRARLTVDASDNKPTVGDA